MRDIDIYGLVIVTMLIGGFLTFLGWVIRSQNAGDMLNGFDPKKYDKNKVSKIVGTDFLYTGLLVLILGTIGAFLTNNFYNYISFTQFIIVVIGIIKAMYDMDIKCKMKR